MSRGTGAIPTRVPIVTCVSGLDESGNGARARTKLGTVMSLLRLWISDRRDQSPLRANSSHPNSSNQDLMATTRHMWTLELAATRLATATHSR